MRLEGYKEWVISSLEDVLCREDRLSQLVCNLLYVSASKKKNLLVSQFPNDFSPKPQDCVARNLNGFSHIIFS